MTSNYEFVRYRPEFRAQICSLQQHLWGPDLDLNSAYFEWKHEQNPFVDGPLVYLALSGGEVVAMRGMMGGLWEGGDGLSPTEIPIAGDLVVRPDHRAKGVMGQLMEFALDDMRARGYRYVLNLSGNSYTQRTSLRMGWQIVGECGDAHWNGRPGLLDRYLGALGRFLSRRLRMRSGHPFAGLDGRFGPGSSPISVACTPRPSEMARLIAQIPWDGRLRQRRDERYFQWRFQNPRSAYRFFFFDDGNLRGYLVLEARRQGASFKARLADWEATDLKVAGELLHAVVRSAGILRLTTWTGAFESGRAGLLKVLGFRPVDLTSAGKTGAGTPLLMRALQPAGADAASTLFGRRIDQFSNWDLRPIYSDAG
jgi:GNAT superfamily N-acetyltransferase